MNEIRHHSWNWLRNAIPPRAEDERRRIESSGLVSKWWYVWPFSVWARNRQVFELMRRDIESQIDRRLQESALATEMHYAKLKESQELVETAKAKREFIQQVQANLARLHSQRERNLEREAQILERWNGLADRMEAILTRWDPTSR